MRGRARARFPPSTPRPRVCADLEEELPTPCPPETRHKVQPNTTCAHSIHQRQRGRISLLLFLVSGVPAFFFVFCESQAHLSHNGFVRILFATPLPQSQLKSTLFTSFVCIQLLDSMRLFFLQPPSLPFPPDYFSLTQEVGFGGTCAPTHFSAFFKPCFFQALEKEPQGEPLYSHSN